MNTSQLPSSAFFENDIFPLQKVEHSQTRGVEQSFSKSGSVCFPSKKLWTRVYTGCNLSPLGAPSSVGVYAGVKSYIEDVEGRSLQGVWWVEEDVGSAFRISSSRRAPSLSCVGAPPGYRSETTQQH